MLGGMMQSIGVGGAVNTSGTNLAIDSDAQFTDAGSINNIAIGSGSMANSNSASADYNVAIGYQALEGGTTTGNYNVAIGYQALDSSGAAVDKAIAIGAEVMRADILDGADEAIGIGYRALRYLTSGSSNIAIGKDASYNTTTGIRNVSMGDSAYRANMGGHYCVAIGFNALNTANHAGNDGTVAIGYKAAKLLNYSGSSIAGGNTLIGYYSGYDENIGDGSDGGLTTGQRNTAVGMETLGSALGANGNITGDDNTTIGYKAGLAVAGAAHSNTFIGSYAGNTTTTGTENTIVGYNCETYDGTADNQIVLGNNVTATDHNGAIFIGNDTRHIRCDYSADQTWDAGSDKRIKNIIGDSPLGLEFIKSIPVKVFKFKAPSEYPKEFNSYNANNTIPTDTLDHHGLIAQDVKKALDEAGVKDFSGWGEDEDGMQTVGESAFVYPLMKAVQELSQQIEDLKKG